MGFLSLNFCNKMNRLVQELTKQLDELRKGKFLNGSLANISVLTNTDVKGATNGQSNELEKLKKEMVILNRMNEEQQKRLDDQRNILRRRNEDAGDLDRRIEELTNRLRQKKLASSQGSSTSGTMGYGQTPTTRMHTIVAAVEPLVKQKTSNAPAPILKPPTSVYSKDSAYTPSKTGIIGRIDQAPFERLSRGQPEGINNSYNQYQTNQSNMSAFNRRAAYDQKVNVDNYTKASPATSDPMMRPLSAMGQLYTGVSKHDPVTAKVKPMLAAHRSPSDFVQHSANYPTNSKSASSLSPLKSTSGSANIFAYKYPPPPPTSRPDGLGYSQPNVIMLPNGNVRYTQSSYPRPPPPCPTSISEHALSGYSINTNPELYGQPIPGRSVTIDIEALRRKFAHAPRPLKKRSSITEPERPQGPVIPKLIYDQLYKKADTPFYRVSSDQEHRSTPPPAYIEPSKPAASLIEPKPNKDETVDVSDSVSYESNLTPTEFLKQQKTSKQDSSNAFIGSFVADDNDDEEELAKDNHGQDIDDESNSIDNDYSSDLSDDLPLPLPPLDLVPGKGILKPLNATSKGANRHIKFDPLALLLDASLEGEFELVKSIIEQVPDASGANDEGITALHNAVCAGHFDLVKFLVHYGSDINAADTDGWTPLHCAASCNNLPMCKFLVGNGACIFAATLSDKETAADKCEELDEGYLHCSEFLYGCQDKLGVVRQGQVYALYDYKSCNDDELSFSDADLMTVQSKEDENESEWWWARLNDKEGYIPRNLIGLWPRIKPHNKEND